MLVLHDQVECYPCPGFEDSVWHYLGFVVVELDFVQQYVVGQLFSVYFVSHSKAFEEEDLLLATTAVSDADDQTTIAGVVIVAVGLAANEIQLVLIWREAGLPD